MKIISAVFLSVIFLMTSSGFMMYKSLCTCTGKEQVSLFVVQQVCNTQEDEQTELVESCCATTEAESCSVHAADCDCDSPEFTYIKLKNQVVKEDIQFIQVHPVLISVIQTGVLYSYFDYSDFEKATEYTDPPPLLTSSRDFLIHIQQLKIPSLA